MGNGSLPVPNTDCNMVCVPGMGANIAGREIGCWFTLILEVTGLDRWIDEECRRFNSPRY